MNIINAKVLTSVMLGIVQTVDHSSCPSCHVPQGTPCEGGEGRTHDLRTAMAIATIVPPVVINDFLSGSFASDALANEYLNATATMN